MNSTRTIGLIGGLSWKSTSLYYEQINTSGNNHLGAGHTPHILLNSLNFEYLAQTLSNGLNEDFSNYLLKSINRLKAAGSDSVSICCNTAHIVVNDLIKKSPLPIIDIRKSVGEELVRRKISTALILGTKFTMEEKFYKDTIETFGVKCSIPEKIDRDMIHRIIFEELCLGVIKEESRMKIKSVISRTKATASFAVVLACTELPLLIEQKNFDIPIINTTSVHAESILKYSINGYKNHATT